MSIGKLIVEARKQHNMSQEVLAQKIGICRASLGYYERDRIVPSILILERICSVLNVSLRTFLLESSDNCLSEQEKNFISILKEDDELYRKAMSSPRSEIKKWKRYSKIETYYIK